MSASTERPAARPWDEEPDRDAVWEPAGLAFRVGDRVRINLPEQGGECEMHARGNSPELMRAAHGQTGCVLSMTEEHVPGHPLYVAFDQQIVSRVETSPLTYRRWVVTGGWFAWAELVPLPADPAQAAGEGDRG